MATPAVTQLSSSSRFHDDEQKSHGQNGRRQHQHHLPTTSSMMNGQLSDSKKFKGKNSEPFLDKGKWIQQQTTEIIGNAHDHDHQRQTQFDFTGKRILVTGGANGIGRSIVEAFVNLGGLVFVFDKDADSLEKLSKQFPPGNVKGIQVDLRDWDATKMATESILPIHHLANNAGIVEWRDFLDIDLNLIDRIFDVNFKAMLNVAQVVANGMIDHKIREGTIVNTSSSCDTTALKSNAIYSSSKAAIAMLTKVMAVELGGQGIRVNSVRPGLVQTEMLSNLPPKVRNAATEGFLGKTVIPRLVQPFEVAQTVMFLSSPMSKMITGSTVTVDGGFGV